MATDQETWQQGGAQLRAEHEAELEERLAKFQAKLPSPHRLALDLKKQHKLLMEALSSDSLTVVEFIKLCKENREDSELMLAFHGISRVQKHEHAGAGGEPLLVELKWPGSSDGNT